MFWRNAVKLRNFVSVLWDAFVAREEGTCRVCILPFQQNVGCLLTLFAYVCTCMFACMYMCLVDDVTYNEQDKKT